MYIILLIIGLILCIAGCHSCNKAFDRNNVPVTYVVHISHWDHTQEDVVVEGNQFDDFGYYGRDYPFALGHWGKGPNEVIAIQVKDFFIKRKTIHIQ